MISGMVGQQLGMFQGYGGYAQGIGVGAGLYPPNPGMSPGMMPPPTSLMGVRPGQAGMYGEQFAMRMANAGMGGMAAGGAAARGVASMFMPFDPMSGALMGGMMGMAAGPMGAVIGAAGGAAVGAGLGLASYGIQRTVGAYTNAFTGGMQDQASLNSTLRNNFQFFGGQGAMGRGFGQSQMGQIGSMISSELRRNPMSNAQEMNNLIAGGADAGQFTGTRDVQQFTQNFRRMLDNLRSVQRELGGTLTDALSFVRSSQQAGIFQNADRVNFAAEIRTAEAVTGMDRNQLVALSAQGAGIARTFGARGSQGAMGVLRAATTMGAALSSGSVSSELLSEATGGLTGSDAIAAFSTNMMQRAGNFSRRGMGRFSMFAMSNASGSGLDEDMLARFRTGDISVSEVSGAAHRNVRGMGRAHALNSEGRLRGEMMEEGGMSAQIGMMRLMLGDRVLDAGDDTAQLVLQRRFNMSQPESEMMLHMIRNQGRIAETETLDRMGAARATSRGRDITENRSFEAFERALEHGLSDATGLTAARDMGRRTMTRVSSFIERAMNDLMGVAESSLTSSDRGALNRVAMGRATRDDIARLSVGSDGARGGGLRTADLFRESLASTALAALPFGLGEHAPEGMRMSLGRRLEARGVTGLRGEGAEVSAMQAVEDIERARTGSVSGATRTELRAMERERGRSSRAIVEAELEAGGRGSAEFYEALSRRGVSANAADAYMARMGVTDFGAEYNASNLGGGGRTDAGMWQRDLMRGGANLLRMATGGMAGFMGGGMDLLRMTGALGHEGEAETMRALASPGERSAMSLAERIRASADRMDEHAADATREERTATRRITESMRGIGEEALTTLAENEEFQASARRLSGATTPEDVRAEIESMRETAILAGDTDQRRAMEGIATAMSEEFERTGSIGDEWRSTLAGVGMSDERRAELIRERNLRVSRARGTAERLGEALTDRERTEGMSGGARGRSEMIATLATARAEAAETGDLDAESAANRRYFEYIARLDPNSDEHRMWSEALPEGEAGELERMRVSHLRQFTRDVSGGGRRGARGAAAAALEGLTGGTMSDLSFTIGGGDTGRRERTVRGSDTSSVMRLLTAGGADSEAIQRQLREHLSGLGIENADDLVSQFTELAEGGFSADTSGGRSEAERLSELFEESGVTEAVERRETEETLANQRRTDPLGVERNALLTTMEGHLRTIATASGDQTVPPPPTGGAGATPVST